MKRVVYSEFGHPADVVSVLDVTRGPLDPGQVRIDVMRSPINPSDLLQIAGQYGVKPPLPATPGNEGIGRIVDMAEDVQGLKIDQIVMIPAGIGVWQQQIDAPALGLIPLPEADLDQLSMITINPPTAYLLLDDFVDLQAGDWIIQSAANSAVGGYVIQLAKERGIRTINIVRREDAIAPLQQLGADVVVLDGPNMEADIRAAVGDGKIRLGIDAVSGALFARMADLLSNGGTMVSYGALSGEAAQVSPQATIFRDIQVRGFWLARWFGVADQARKIDVFSNLITRIATGAITAPVEAVYGLDDIHTAMEHAAKPNRSGKILIAPNG